MKKLYYKLYKKTRKNKILIKYWHFEKRNHIIYTEDRKSREWYFSKAKKESEVMYYGKKV